MSNEAKESKDKPVDKIDVHPVHGAIWRNTGSNGTYFSATFEKRYKDKEGQWHGTQSYSGDDLLALSKAADKAHDRILELQKDKSWAQTLKYGEERAAATGATPEDVQPEIEASRREAAARRR